MIASTQDMHSVRGEHHRRLDLIDHRADRAGRVRFASDGVDAPVRAPALRHLLKRVIDIVFARSRWSRPCRVSPPSPAARERDRWR